MAGQSTHLSRKESIALQKKVDCSPKATHGEGNGGHFEELKMGRKNPKEHK